ncbi:DHA2 family efflux MFS transporter permease subunit [Streptomyces sp. WELS2]|uniref:DHA2 family efflux MFS transporter permease subunit n=1 Tax=Streptomyces sp. WELS2 TaxID=2749435 RepID=UPI001C688B3D|nr:DHA2 family efflux MFS transporter permease subunit [Streptomyces sp. WELS2]
MAAPSRPWPALTALIVGYFMVVLDMTIVAVANPVIMDSLHADVTSLVWATSAYLLTFAALLLPAGRLGDHFGPKRVYLTGLALFTAASLACGLAPAIGALIAARAVQGVGAALVTPQTMAVITRTFPPERRSAAMSLWGAVAGLANLIGPLLGGLLVDRAGWQWIFYVNIPVGLAGLALAVRYVPALPAHTHRFDLTGLVLSSIGMSLLVLGIQEGGSRGWGGWTWWSVAAGLAVLGVFVAHQARTSTDPLLPLGIFRDRAFAAAALAVGLAAAAVAAVMVPLYLYLESVRDLAGTKAGLLLAPMALLAIVFVPVIALLGDRLHPRVAPVTGLALFAATLAGFALLMTPDSPVGLFLAGAALAGVANACIWPSLAVAATLRLPPEQAGAGAGVYNALRQVGSVLGSAAVGAVVASRMAVHGLPPDLAGGTGAEGGTTVPEALRAAFGSALADSVYLPVALLALGAVAAALIVRSERPAPQARPSSSVAVNP